MKGIEFSPYGSWLIKDKKKKRGVEPDECYVIGEIPNRRRPHLAIEVVWTSGGLGKLDIYRGLGVPEVWIWKRGRIGVHALRGRGPRRRYEEIDATEVLPGIDLVQLSSFLGIFPMSRAKREYCTALARANAK